MNEKKYPFELLTPTLCHGAFPQESAELRETSIRGKLRRWHTILWGAEDAVLCWGDAGTSTRQPHASKVVLRLVRPEKEKTQTTQYLPHKQFQTNAQALCAAQKYALEISFRHLGNTEVDVTAHVEKTIRCWLLMGTVGQRGTRGFGSVWPLDTQPGNIEEYERKLRELLANRQYAFRLSPPINGQPDLKVCTDTLRGEENEKFFGYVIVSKVI